MGRKAGRSFAALVAVGVSIELGAAAVAALGLRTLARCYMGSIAGSRTSRPVVCMEPIAGVGFHLFVPAVVLAALLCASIALVVKQMVHAIRGVKRVDSLLGPRVTTVPEALLSAAHQAGASMVDLRDHAKPYGVCIGILHPRVVVSTALLAALTPRELVAVLAHEERHRRRRAPLRRFVARVTARALFYMPVLNDLCAAQVVEEEVVADEESCAVVGTRCLVQALAKLSGATRPGGTAAAIGDAATLPYRLQSIREGRIARPPLGRLSMAVSASSLCALVLLFVWIPMSGHH